MIRVPQVPLSVPQQPAPTPTQVQTPAPMLDPAQMASGTASGLATAGMRAQAQGEKAIENANLARVRQQVGRARMAFDSVLTGDGGYLYSIGEDAVNRREDTLKRLQTELEKFNGEGVFDNDVQRDMFQRAIEADIVKSQHIVYGHWSKQTQVFNAATAKALYEQTANDIARFGWSKDTDQQLRADVDAYRQAQQLPVEVGQALFREARAGALTTHIQALIAEGSLDEAQEALDKAYDPAPPGQDVRPDRISVAQRTSLSSRLTKAREVKANAEKLQAAADAEQAVRLNGEEQAQIAVSNNLQKGMTEEASFYDAKVSVGQQMVETVNDDSLDADEKAIRIATLTAAHNHLSAMQGLAREEISRRHNEAADLVDSALNNALSAGVSFATQHGFEEHLKSQHPDAVSRLQQTAAGRDLLTAQFVRFGKHIEATSREKAKRIEAELDQQAANIEMMTSQEFADAWPNTEGARESFRSHLRVFPPETQKKLLNKFDGVHKRPEYDAGLGGIRTSVNSYLETLPQLATPSTGSALIKSQMDNKRFSAVNAVAEAWNENAESSGQDPKDLVAFHKWWKQITTAEGLAPYEGEGGSVIPAPLAMILARSTDIVASRRLPSERDIRLGEATATIDSTYGPVNALDLVLRAANGLSLPRQRRRPLTPEEFQEAEILWDSIGRPDVDSLLRDIGTPEFARHMDDAMDPPKPRGIAFAQADPIAQNLFAARLDEYERVPEGTQTSDFELALNQELQTVWLDLLDAEAERTPMDTIESMLELRRARIVSDLDKLLRSTTLYDEYKKRVPVGPRPQTLRGWGSRDKMFDYPYMGSYQDYLRETQKYSPSRLRRYTVSPRR